MPKQITIAFLGVAHFHANNYAAILRGLPETKLEAIYESDRKLGREFADRFCIEYSSDYETLLADKSIEAVVITAETAKHRELAVRAAEAGKHILCEKPIAMNLTESDEILQSVQRSNLKFQMCHVMRYHSAARLVKSLVDEGRIGKITAMIGTNKVNASQPLSRAWFVDKRLSGGGAIMDHTVHLSDLMRWYTKSEVVEIFTEVGKNVSSGIEVEDNFLTTLTLGNGAIGHVDGSWSYANGFYTWGDFVLEVLGTEGVIFLDAFRQNIYFCGSEAPKDKLLWYYYGCDADREMILDFANCITNDDQPKASAFDGRHALEITLSSYDSAETGKPVRIP